MEAQEFLSRHGRKLASFEYCFGVDNNQNPPEAWDAAQRRILFVFCSTGDTRSVSNTYTVLDNVIRNRYGKDIFVDYAYIPEKEDLATYRKAGADFLFGNVSHRNWREYDVVCFSVAILQELWNIPFMLKANGIKLGFDQRMADEGSPLIMAGGVTSTMSDILFGDVDDETRCLFDCVYVGHLEPGSDGLFRYILQHDTRRNKRAHLAEMVKICDHLYVPAMYHFDYELDEKYGYRINSVTPADGYPETVYMAHMDSMDHPGFERKILNVSGEAVQSGDLDISSGCSGGGQCTFCYEGVVGGKWMERGLPEIVERMKILRASGAPNTVGFYSYNLNYFGQFIDLLHESARRFSNLSLINMRADVIGADPRYLDISMLLGLRRASLPVEGIGERIRNNFLNKNLTYRQWLFAAKVIFQCRLAECKHGMIYSGYENQKDYDQSLREFEGVLALRDRMGANTSVRCTFTPLVYYPHTPLARLTRVTSIQNLTEDRRMTPYLRALNDMGIRTKVNGRSKSTFMEQFLLDFGRMGTKYLVKAAGDAPPFYGSISPDIEETLISSMKRDGINVAAVLQYKPEESILWQHPVEAIDRRYLNRWVKKAMRQPEVGFSMRQCTTSPANFQRGQAPTNQVGYEATCSACSSCQTKTEITSVVERPVESASGFNEVMSAINGSRPKFMTLVGVDIKPDWFQVSSKMLAHRIAGHIISTDMDNLEPYLFQVGKTSFSWVVENFQRDWFSGRFIFPNNWSQRPEIPADAINRINSELRSARIYAISEPSLPDKRFVKLDDVNLWRIVHRESNRAKLASAFLEFDNQMPVAQKSVQRELVLADKPVDISTPVVGDHPLGSVMYVAMPVQFNPYLFMVKMTRGKFNEMTQQCDISSLGTFRNQGNLCATDGCSGHVFNDIMSRMGLKQCLSCISKVMLSREQASLSTAA